MGGVDGGTGGGRGVGGERVLRVQGMKGYVGHRVRCMRPLVSKNLTQDEWAVRVRPSRHTARVAVKALVL